MAARGRSQERAARDADAALGVAVRNHFRRHRIGDRDCISVALTDNPNPYVDSSLFVWSLVAQWMTARKWIENWVLWVVINTISVPLYVVRGLLPTALLYVGLWILAILGYRQWRKTLIV
jgi:nicotinamide mononucleotide transporter PnuC